MVRKCSIVGCCNRNSREHRSKGISFHRFPSDTDLRRLWVTAVQSLDAMKDWHPGKSACVCSEHFEKDDIRYDRGFNLLKPSVIPSRFRLSHKVRNNIDANKTVADLRQTGSKGTATDSNNGNFKEMADLQCCNSDETNSRDAPMMIKANLQHSSFKQVTDADEAADSMHGISMEATADSGRGNSRQTPTNLRLVTLNTTEQMQCDASSKVNRIQPLVLSGSNLKIKSIDPIKLSGENFKIKTLQPLSPNQLIYRLSDGQLLILSPWSFSSTTVPNVDVPIQEKDHRSKPNPDIYSIDCAVHVPFDAKAINLDEKSSSPLPPILSDSPSKNDVATVLAARKTFVLRKLAAREFLLQRDTDSRRAVSGLALRKTLRTCRDSKKSLLRQNFQSFHSKQKKLGRSRNDIVHWLHAKT